MSKRYFIPYLIYLLVVISSIWIGYLTSIETISLELSIGILGLVTGFLGIGIGIHLYIRQNLSENEIKVLIHIFENNKRRRIVKVLHQSGHKYIKELHQEIGGSLTSLSGEVNNLEQNRVIFTKPIILRNRRIVRMCHINKEYDKLLNKIIHTL